MARIDEATQHRLTTTRLPALPQALLRLLELCRRDDSGLDDLAHVIGQDPALSVKIISLARTAERHGSVTQRGLLQTLMQVGVDAARTAVIGESIQQVFSSMADGQSIQLGGFWRHSLGAAILAKRLARAMKYPHVEEAYLGGLLHDVGQLAIMAAFPNEYRHAFAEHQDDHWVSNWEEMTLGFTHAEVGAWLAARWQLDDFLVDAMLYHHEVADQVAVAHPLVRIVWLAHMLEHNDGSALPEMPDMDGIDLQAIREGLDDEVQKAAEMLSIKLADPADMAGAQARLAEEVREFALIGALQTTRAGPTVDVTRQLRAVALSAQTLFDLGDCLFYRIESGHLRALAPWPHLQRSEELGIPVGERGGCVGRCASSGRLESTWGSEAGRHLLDDQLLRQLARKDAAAGLLCVPLSSDASQSFAAQPDAVLVFAAPESSAALLRARPELLRAFVGEAAKRLLPAGTQARSETGLREQVRRAVHEANNPLGIIKNYLHILGGQLGGAKANAELGEGLAKDLSEDLSMINTEIDRVSRILRNLSSPPAAGAVATVLAGGADLNRTVRELLSFCQDTHFVPEGIKIEVALQDDLPGVLADRDSLKQILLNLLKNGVEAMAGKGKISIVTSGPLLREDRPFLQLRVSDDGPGLPADVQARLFKPVDTRKGEGHSGLGLAIVGELVGKLGGQISCRSDSAGTLFEILLPSEAQQGDTE